MLRSRRRASPDLWGFEDLARVIRISTIFVAICMVLVAASLGLVLYSVAGISGSESAIVALTALTFLILYNAVSMRLRDRSDVSGQIADLSRGTADLARQVAEFGRRLAAVEGRVVSANSANHDRVQSVAGEINELGVLVQQLAVSVASHDDMLSSGAFAAAPRRRARRTTAGKRNCRSLPMPRKAPARRSSRRPLPRRVAADASTAPRSNAQILTAVKNAIEANRIDIYLQPMVTLPQRKVRFYEAVTRLRDDKDQILTADDFIGTAEAAGLMGRIDHMVMLRCVQVLRRLMVRNKEVGVFCNVAAATLSNPATFAQCLDFLEANRALAASLRARIQAEHVPQSWAGGDRTSRGIGAARLSFLDRPRHRSADRAARPRRPRRAFHQGAGVAAAGPAADLGVRHSSFRSLRPARPLRHRSRRRADRGRACRGRPARL